MKCFNCRREDHKKDYRVPPKQQNGPDHAKSPVNKPNPDPIALVDMGKAKMYVVEVDKDDEEMRTRCIVGN